MSGRAGETRPTPGPPAALTDTTLAAGRAADLLALRRARLAAVEPARPSRIIDFLATAETDGFDQLVTFQAGNYRFGIGKISPVSGLTPAIRYELPRIGKTDLTLRTSGAYSLIGHSVVDFRLGVFEEVAPHDFLGQGFLGAPFEFDQRSQQPLESFLYADLRYRNSPRELFYGLGPDSQREDRTGFRLEDYAADIVWGKPLTRWAATQLRAGWVRTWVGPGTDDSDPAVQEIFGEDRAPGSESGVFDAGRLDAALYLGWLAAPDDPAFQLGLRYARFDDLDRRRFEFDRWSLDGRAYLPLGSRVRVLAFRAYAATDTPDRGATVPFFALQSLGGDETLRGFDPFRFRDSRLLYFSGEYRWESSSAVQLAVFYDVGKVFPDGGDFNLDGLESSWGGGIRGNNWRRTVFRLDVGHGREGTQVHVSLGPAF